MIDRRFQACVDALDAVTDAWRAHWKSKLTIGRYEADTAGLRLMHNAYLHVNAVAHIASIPYTGSHLVSAWVLLRAAFETSVTAMWLTHDDDWKERESRWLGWMAAEEKHWSGIAEDLRVPRPDLSRRATEDVQRLTERRRLIAEKLPKDSRIKRPSLPEMIRELGINPICYLNYRLGSHIVHGGPSCTEMSISETDQGWSFGQVVRPAEWNEPFRLASWCIVTPGVVVLRRHGADPQIPSRLAVAHESLIRQTDALEASEPNQG